MSKADTILAITSNEINHWKNFTSNANIQHTISENSKLTADVDYVYYMDDNPTDYVNAYFKPNGSFLYNNRTRSTKQTPINIFAAKTDYTNKLGKKVDFESGLKIAHSTFTNDVGVSNEVQGQWKFDDTLTARYSLDETIAAVYSSFSVVLSDKTTMKFGLRYEQTKANLSSLTKKNIVDRKYGNLFPTFYINQKLGDNSSVNLSLNKRITRPSFTDLAPFVIFMDPYTFISGNPALQPSISYSAKTDYNYKNYIFSLSFTHTNDPIASFQTRVNAVNNKQYLSPENLHYQNSLNASVAMPVTVTKWWSMQNNVTAEWSEINAPYDNNPILISQKNFQLFSSQTFKLPKEISMELSGFYLSGGLFGRSIMSSFYSLDFGMQKKISEKAGTIRFGVDNILNSMKFRPRQNFPQFNLVSEGLIIFSSRLFKLTYTRKFGNSILKSQRNRTTGSEEERNRVNN